MAGATSKNTEIVKFFFTPVPGISDKFLCKYGKERKQNPKRGHGNLLEHITREHKNYLEEVRSNGLSRQSNIEPFWQRIRTLVDKIHGKLTDLEAVSEITSLYLFTPNYQGHWYQVVY